MGKLLCSFLILHPGPSDTVGTLISFQGNQALVAFTARQNLTLNITGKSNLGIDDTIITTWYHNDCGLSDFRFGTTIKRTHLNISQSLTLENSSIFDAGTYDVLLTIDPHTYTSYPTLDAIETTIHLLIVQSEQMTLFLPKHNFSLYELK